MIYESENIEYKSQMLEDLYKEVIAFANTDSGVIYIGIDDHGNLTLSMTPASVAFSAATRTALYSIRFR